MQPPIPEVPKSEPRSGVKPPFFGLTVACVVDAINAVLTIALMLMLWKPEYEEPLENAAFFFLALTFLSLYLGLVFSVWLGLNWARWLFVFFIVSSSVWLFFTEDESGEQISQIEQIYNDVSLIWSIGFAIWLLLPGVARHFRRQKSDTSTEINAG